MLSDALTLSVTLYQQDYVKRQIELFADALVRIVRKRQNGDNQQALDETRHAYQALGLDPSFLRLDVSSLVNLVGSPNKLSALCDLLEEEANVLDALSNTTNAKWLRQRASAIRATLT